MPEEDNNTDVIAVYVTAPDEDEAARIARELVGARLAACVNIIRGIRSIYRWQEKIEDDSEVLMIIKTRRNLFKSLAAEVVKLHSYDVPEVIAVPISDGSDNYLKWIRESTG